MEGEGRRPEDGAAPTGGGIWRHFWALALAVVGGALGVVGAGIEELRAGGGLVLAFISAPLVEEALKPSGIYIGLVRWPWLMRGRLYTAVLTAIAGLTFGVIESLVYVYVYVSDPPAWFVTYRFTVNVGVHAGSSFLMGLGLNQGLVAWARGQGPLPKGSRNLYLAAVGVHSAYNAAVVVLGLAGVFDGTT